MRKHELFKSFSAALSDRIPYLDQRNALLCGAMSVTYFHAAFDETGMHHKDGVMRLIGLMTTHVQWNALHLKWKDVLNSQPPIQSWHTVSAHNGKLGLERTAREKKEASLCAVLSELAVDGNGKFSEVLASIEISMSLRDHREQVIGKIDAPKFKEKLSPYSYEYLSHKYSPVMREAMMACAYLSKNWMEGWRPGQPFEVYSIFERDKNNDRFEFDVLNSFLAMKWSMKPEMRDILTNIMFAPSVGPLGIIPLQLVDMFAWHVQAIENGKPEQPGWEHMKLIKRNRFHLDAERLACMVATLNAGTREGL